MGRVTSTDLWPSPARGAVRRCRRLSVHCRAVFDTLSGRLQAVLGDVGRAKRLDEESVSKAMREIRLALLEADVNFEVVKRFVEGVRERALGHDVLEGLDAGQQVVKIVHEELTELMGAADAKLAFGRPPTVVLVCGLQGSGKTTTCAKLALHLRKHDGKTPGLVAADLQRPAAIDQLEQLGRQIQVPVYRGDGDAVAVSKDGVEWASAQGCDVVIVDTAGRLHVDEELMTELEQIHRQVKPLDVLLVLDAMTGQEAVNVAQAFQERIAFDGVVLTKLDGDARGGAALSVKAITGRPVMFASVGEKVDALEVFHPDRMASRILGMGDVLTLIEKAEQAVAEDEQEDLERADSRRRVQLRRLSRQLPHAPADGAAQGSPQDDPGDGRPARRARHRRAADGSHRGDRALDDPRGAPHPAPDQRPAPSPHRRRERHLDRRGEPAAAGTQADAEDDAADGPGQVARRSLRSSPAAPSA